MYEGIKKENKIYFYGFSKLHQLQGKPWNLRGDWITLTNIHETAERMLQTMDTVEVIAVDASYEIGREYKDLASLKNWNNQMEHICFYDFVKSRPHFEFRG